MTLPEGNSSKNHDYRHGERTRDTTPWGTALDNVSLRAVPEPTTMIAGVLLLLPFGASALKILRENRVA